MRRSGMHLNKRCRMIDVVLELSNTEAQRSESHIFVQKIVSFSPAILSKAHTGFQDVKSSLESIAIELHARTQGISSPNHRVLIARQDVKMAIQIHADHRDTDP